MDQSIQDYIDKHDAPIQELFMCLRYIILSSTDMPIDEKLWAKLPSYYVGDHFVRLIPFKNHINIEAKALSGYFDDLKTYCFTPKGMLQIKPGDTVPRNILLQAFCATFKDQSA